VTIRYLLVLATMLAILEPEGPGWTLTAAGAGIGVGTTVLIMARRVWQPGLTRVFGRSRR